jgi:hypothetical protein
MPDLFSGVKMLTSFFHRLLMVAHAFEHLWMFLWKKGKKLISHSLSNNDSMGCISGF